MTNNTRVACVRVVFIQQLIISDVRLVEASDVI